ncbi:hypothetical protein M758_8G131200 [Ceratodon purpureus]|nr:hypothetical protein M758_8G131200 [Ceratodon purpureus]
MSRGSELPVLPTSKPPDDGPKKQWIKQVVNAAGAVHKFEKPIVARRAVHEGTDRLKANGRNGSEAKYKQNQPPELEIQELSVDVTYPYEFMKSTHRALNERLNMFAIVFTLLEPITFVAILQPPGGFDNDGHIRSNSLVTWFMFFSTSSFFFTTIGLYGVVVGILSLFSPDFYPKLEIRASSAESSQSGTSQDMKSLPSSDTSGSSYKYSLSSDRSSSLLYNAYPRRQVYNNVHMDDLTVLAKLLRDNFERISRLRIYLIFSLVFIVSAFGCGVFAILGGSHRTKYLLAGPTIVGVLTLIFEAFKTVQGIQTYDKSKWLELLQYHTAPGANLPQATPTPRERLVDLLDGIVHSPRYGSGTTREQEAHQS